MNKTTSSNIQDVVLFTLELYNNVKTPQTCVRSPQGFL